MKTEDNYIDKLVRDAIPDQTDPIDNAELWNSISRALRFRRFFKFSLNSFNIYYSALILGVVVTSAVYFTSKNDGPGMAGENKNCVKQEVVKADQTSASDSLNAENKGEAASVPAENNSGNNLSNNNTATSVQASTVAENGQSETKTAEAKEAEIAAAAKQKKVKVVKKKYVINDTVRHKDTVVMKK